MYLPPNLSPSINEVKDPGGIAGTVWQEERLSVCERSASCLVSGPLSKFILLALAASYAHEVDMIKWAWMVILDVFHVVYMVICISLPISLA